MIRRDHDAIDRLVVELHGAILQLRMVPVAQVFRSFPRLVRDVSRQLDKNVEIRPQELAMAKTLIDNLTDHFQPDQFTDQYRQRLEAAAEAKIAGEEVAMARTATTTPRKLPRQQRSQETVAALLEATARVLIRDGYDRASTNRIAEAAGVLARPIFRALCAERSQIDLRRHGDRRGEPVPTCGGTIPPTAGHVQTEWV